MSVTLTTDVECYNNVTLLYNVVYSCILMCANVLPCYNNIMLLCTHVNQCRLMYYHVAK